MDAGPALPDHVLLSLSEVFENTGHTSTVPNVNQLLNLSVTSRKVFYMPPTSSIGCTAVRRRPTLVLALLNFETENKGQEPPDSFW